MRIGPNIDPRGAQRIISSNLLNEKFNLPAVCFLRGNF